MHSELAGATVVLTREADDGAALLSHLESAGVEVVELPCIRTEPLADTRALADAIASLGPDDWLVVTSRHGADAVARCGWTDAAVAAVGEATADRLRVHGLTVSFEPSSASGERLARELPERAGVVMLARSDRAMPDLPRILADRGFTVREVVAYRTIVGPQGDASGVRALLASDRRVVVVFHSPSAVEGLLQEIEPGLIARAEIFVAGATTERAVRDGLGPGARVDRIREVEAHVARR